MMCASGELMQKDRAPLANRKLLIQWAFQIIVLSAVDLSPKKSEAARKTGRKILEN
jgi:hypothetical protein